MFVHLEDIADVTNEQDIYRFLCPHCDSKLEAACFGDSIEKHKLKCYKCKKVWKLSRLQFLYKVEPLTEKECKTFF